MALARGVGCRAHRRRLEAIALDAARRPGSALVLARLAGCAGLRPVRRLVGTRLARVAPADLVRARKVSGGTRPTARLAREISACTALGATLPRETGSRRAG